jgi:hypothetical protein
MTPETPRPQATEPNSESLAPAAAGSPALPLQPAEAITADPAAPEAKTQTGSKHASILMDNNRGFPRLASRVGVVLGLLFSGWIWVGPLASTLWKGNALDGASDCGCILLSATMASVALSVLFWSIGFVLQAVYLSFRHARDPIVQQMSRNIEEANEDDSEEEWWVDCSSVDPDSNADIQSKTDAP